MTNDLTHSQQLAEEAAIRAAKRSGRLVALRNFAVGEHQVKAKDGVTDHRKRSFDQRLRSRQTLAEAVEAGVSYADLLEKMDTAEEKSYAHTNALLKQNGFSRG